MKRFFRARYKRFRRLHFIQASLVAIAIVPMILLVHRFLWNHWVHDTDSVDVDSLSLELAFAGVTVALITTAVAAGLGWYVVLEYREAHPKILLRILAHVQAPVVPIMFLLNDGNQLVYRELQLTVSNSGDTVADKFSLLIPTRLIRDIELYFEQNAPGQNFNFTETWDDVLQTRILRVREPGVDGHVIKVANNQRVAIFPGDSEGMILIRVPEPVWNAHRNTEMGAMAFLPNEGISKIKFEVIDAGQDGILLHPL